MDDQGNRLFEGLEDSLSVSAEEILLIARAMQAEGLSEEGIIRQLLRELSQLANQPMSVVIEDEIVEMIINRRIPSSIDVLDRFTGG